MAKSVTIISAWSDDNKGDAGILIGLIKLVQQTIHGDDLVINLISHFSSDDSRFDYHHRFVKDAMGNGVRLYSAIMPVRVNKLENRLSYRFQMIKGMFFSLLILLLAPGLNHLKKHPLLTSAEFRALVALSQSDIVICKGGHEIYTRNGIGSFIAFYIRMFPLLLALRLRQRVVIYGQSIGPVDGFASRWLLGYVLRRCESILVREPLSHQLILNRVGPSLLKRSGVTWDTGFFIEAQGLPDDISARLPDQFVACTLRPWNFPETPGESAAKYQCYLKTMAEIISRLGQQWGLPVVLVPQVTGPSSQVSDYTAWDDLRAYLPDEHNLLEIHADLSPGQLVTIYQKADVVIGTRFHSIIFAIAAKSPGLAISYHGYKTTGIMKMLRLLDYVIEIDDIDIDILWEKLQQLRAQRETIIRHLATQMIQIREQSLVIARSVLTFNEG